MAPFQTPTAFYAKLWTCWALFFIWGGLGFFGCVIGPLFLCGIIQPANGSSGTVPGIMSTLVGVFCVPIALTTLVDIVHLQKPLIQLYQEGIRIRIFAKYWFDQTLGFEIIILPIESIWRLVSRRAFVSTTIDLPWEAFKAVSLNWNQLEIYRQTIIKSSSFSMAFDSKECYQFSLGIFKNSGKQIQDAILQYGRNPDLREQLESWGIYPSSL